MKWLEIKVNAKAEAIDAITEILYEFGASGVAIDEPIDYEAMKIDNLFWDYIEPQEGEQDKESSVSAYFSEAEAELENKIQGIKDKVQQLPEFGLDIGSGKIEIKEIDQIDWETSWKQYFKPVHITDRIVVKPQWEEYLPQEDELIIHIDPGMAFGTGTHETTSMCIKAIEKNLEPGYSILDIGTGSGILSIAAVLLGAKEATGVDLDPVAVEVANENIEINGLSDKITILHGDLLTLIEGQFDIVVANIIADAILILLDSDVKSFVKDNGLFICSGIIQEKEDLVVEKLKGKGFEIKEINRDGEWVCITSTCHG